MGDIPDVYLEAIRSGGITEAEVREMLSEHWRWEALLDQGKCPECEAAVEGEFDGYRGDVHPTNPGHWIKYHCKACGYVCCRVKQPTDELDT